MTEDGFVNELHRHVFYHAIAEIETQNRIRQSGTPAERDALDRRILDCLRVVKDCENQDQPGTNLNLWIQSPFWACAPKGWQPALTWTTANSNRAAYGWNETAGVEGDTTALALDNTVGRPNGTNHALMAVVGGGRENVGAKLVAPNIAGSTPLRLVEGDGNVDGADVTIGPHGFIATALASTLGYFELKAGDCALRWEDNYLWKQIKNGVKVLIG